MKKKGLVILGILLLVYLSACGKPSQESMEVQESVSISEDFLSMEGMSLQKEASPEDMSPEDSEQESGMSREERLEYDWRNEEWKLDDAGDWGHRLYAADYIYGLNSEFVEDYEDCRRSYCILGGRIYSIDEYYKGEEREEYFYYLNCYDSFTGEIWHCELELLQLPELKEYGDGIVYFCGFDMQSEQELVAFLHIRADEENWNTLAYLAIHMSMEGEMLSVLDLYPAMLAGGAKDYEGENIDKQSGIYSPGDVYLDRDGNYYMRLVSWEMNDGVLRGRFISEISIVDPSGIPLGTMKPQNGHSPSFAMKTPKGDPVFRWFTGTGVNSSALMYFDKETQEPKQLLKLKEDLWGSNLWVGAMSGDGYLYFMDKSSRLNRCDLYTGKREYCLSYGSLGLGDWPGMVAMALGPDGEPVFLDTYEDYAICRLGSEAPETDPVRLVSLTEACTFIENQSQRFSKRHMDHPIEVEKPEENQETYRMRMMAELVSGKGADIYYVSGTDMQILYENGVLADLSGVLPEQIEKAVYPGVLDGGVRGNQRVGIAPEARAVTMMVSGKYWDGENWGLEELLDVADAHPELTYPVIWGQQYMDSGSLLQVLLFQDLDSTPFLDLQSGSCDFENPLFIRLLELAKRYYDRPIEISRERNMPRELLEEGNYAAVVLSPRDFPEFNQIMSLLPEDCYQAGIPTEEGSGCYWQTDYYLVVNKNAKYPELIYEFLAYLLEEDSQDRSMQPVRRDMLERHILTDDSDDKNPMRYTDGKGGYYFLETGADGTVWQEEYEQMQSRSVLVTKDTGHIRQIITEEVENYFTGVRDAEAVAGLIQNRVQLYLQEQGTLAGEGLKKGGQPGLKHPTG